MGYFNEFINAIERTSKLKLEIETPFIDSTEKFIRPETYGEIKRLVKEKFPEFENGKYAYQCMDISYKMMPILENYFDTDVFLTIGDISIDEKKIFNFDEKYIQELLSLKQHRHNLKLHAWLTLTSMEIVDLSLGQTILSMTEKLTTDDYILNSPDNLLNGLRYHPMVIGGDFLHKTGNLVYL